MAKLIATLKAILTRILFGAHGAIAIWQVTQYKKNPIWWAYLGVPIGILAFEGLFTLAIKKTQEWRWFCPSVFLYLSSVVPAIWLLELEKIEKKHKIQEDFNLVAAAADFKELDKLLGTKIRLPDIKVDAETWVTLIEQFLMLVLIIGRWLLPKGDLTRDQLSQLLLVYIGTAADIIEFFDSFKDKKIADEQILVFLTLSIWSWSLLQFTIVLTATRARKPRGASSSDALMDEDSTTCCTSLVVDIWGIALNIILQDAPFLTFRLLIIIHYEIISYMNVFFTCKNTLVILLQLYRLYVVYSESRKNNLKKRKLRNFSKERNSKARGKIKRRNDFEDVYTISNEKASKSKKRKNEDESDTESDYGKKKSAENDRKKTKSRKDKGYGTEESFEDKRKKDRKREKQKSRKDGEEKIRSKKKRESSDEDGKKSKKSKREKIVEESESASEQEIKKQSKKKRSSSSSSSNSSSD